VNYNVTQKIQECKKTVTAEIKDLMKRGRPQKINNEVDQVLKIMG
jgi:hypothetical protein